MEGILHVYSFQHSITLMVFAVGDFYRISIIRLSPVNIVCLPNTYLSIMNENYSVKGLLDYTIYLTSTVTSVVVNND